MNSAKPLNLLKTPSGKEVHIWQFNLRDMAGPFNTRILSADELDKLSAYKYNASKNRFLYGRTILRLLLSEYLGQNPTDIRFGYNQAGKPFHIPEIGQESLQFNLSHSGNLLLLSFSKDSELGIDVEEIKPLNNPDELAVHFLSLYELSGFLNLGVHEKLSAFYSTWVRKESFLKALGTGLSISPCSFELSTHDPYILQSPDFPAIPKDWEVIDLQVQAGYRASLTAEGTGNKVVYQDSIKFIETCLHRGFL